MKGIKVPLIEDHKNTMEALKGEIHINSRQIADALASGMAEIVPDLVMNKDGEAEIVAFSVVPKYTVIGIDPAKPAPTVTGRGDPRGGVVVLHHPRNHRRMTARELATTQSFPMDFVFSGSRTSAYIQIANAVPPLLGKAIAGTFNGRKGVLCGPIVLCSDKNVGLHASSRGNISAVYAFFGRWLFWQGEANYMG